MVSEIDTDNGDQAREGIARCRSHSKPSASEALNSYRDQAQQKQLESLVGPVGPRQLEQLVLPASAPAALKKLMEASKACIEGHKHRDGIGCPVNVQAAVASYRKSALLGSPEGMFNLGQQLTKGPKLDAASEGLQWLERAAAEPSLLRNPVNGRTLGPGMMNVGVGEAIHTLGNIYRDGRAGLPHPDIKKAIYWYSMGSDRGGAGAAGAENDLGCLFQDGRASENGLPDAKAAAMWYRKAANRGFSIAQFNLATMYMEGSGAPCDLKEARRLLEAAAHQGHVEAKICLSNLQLGGKSSEQTSETLEKAAEGGNSKACLMLGQAYIEDTWA